MWTRKRLLKTDAAAARVHTRIGAVVAALTILYGGLVFGWPGFVAGAALALAHVIVARRGATAPRAILALWHLVALPAALGTLLAATPFDMWFLVGPVLLCLWLFARIPERLLLARSTLPARTAGLLAASLALVVCDRLPVKDLDTKVGPVEYRRVTLRDLTERAYEDLHMFFLVDDEAALTVVDFQVPRPMSKRAVLEKLARETGLELTIGYCGTGESALWGMAPMGIRLRPRREAR